MSTLVVVPMKSPFASKTRLAGWLAPAQRATLARHLFARTISALTALKTKAEFDLAVVTADAGIARSARVQGARAIMDPDRGLNAALSAAAEVAQAEGVARLCVFPADLAAPRACDLLDVIATEAPADAVLIAAATDGGTNALRVRPGAMAFRFGAGSARLHAEAARQAGLRPVMLSPSSLSHDIDTGPDLERAYAKDAALRAIA